MRAIPLLLPVLFSACEPGPAPAAPAAPPEAAAGPVDSLIPIPEALARFRVDLPEAPVALSGGAPGAEALVEELVSRLAAGDTLAFETLAIDRAEFAWLYYPESPLSRPPYELPPALTWFQLQQTNRTGVLRLLRELGGRELRYEGMECAGGPTAAGQNRLWSGCTVRLRVDREMRDLRLFGALIERDGVVKVLSYGNDF